VIEFETGSIPAISTHNTQGWLASFLGRYGLEFRVPFLLYSSPRVLPRRVAASRPFYADLADLTAWWPSLSLAVTGAAAMAFMPLDLVTLRLTFATWLHTELTTLVLNSVGIQSVRTWDIDLLIVLATWDPLTGLAEMFFAACAAFLYGRAR